MTANIETILQERGERYGKFKDHARISQELQSVIFDNMTQEKYDTLRPSQKEALGMIAHKIARIVNGDPHYVDSWRDGAGYFTLVADELEGVER